MEVVELYCTMHPNWSWVLKESLSQICLNTDVIQFSNLIQKSTMKDLPSQTQFTELKQKLVKRKATYSLFRFEVVNVLEGNIRYVAKCCWMSGQCFGFLDAKDALCKQLINALVSCFNIRSDDCTSTIADMDRVIQMCKSSDQKVQFPMPITYLLPWNVKDLQGLDAITELPSVPCLLKAALGTNL